MISREEALTKLSNISVYLTLPLEVDSMARYITRTGIHNELVEIIDYINQTPKLDLPPNMSLIATKYLEELQQSTPLPSEVEEALEMISTFKAEYADNTILQVKDTKWYTTLKNYYIPKLSENNENNS